MTLFQTSVKGLFVVLVPRAFRRSFSEVDLTFVKAERITIAIELAQRNAIDLQPSCSSGGIGVNKVEHKYNKKSKANASSSKPARE